MREDTARTAFIMDHAAVSPGSVNSSLTSEFIYTPGSLYDATVGIPATGIVITTTFIIIRIITRLDIGKFNIEDCKAACSILQESIADYYMQFTLS